MGEYSSGREILILGEDNKRWEKSGEEEKFEGENKGWEFSMLLWPIMSSTNTSYHHVMIAWPTIKYSRTSFVPRSSKHQLFLFLFLFFTFHGFFFLGVITKPWCSRLAKIYCPIWQYPDQTESYVGN